MVEAQHGIIAERIDYLDLHIGGFSQQREKIAGRVLPPIDFAGLQRGGGGGGVRDGVPLDAIEMRDLRAGGADGRAIRAGHIAGEAFVHREGTGHPLVHVELVGAAADQFRHLLRRFGQSQALGHHDGCEGIGLAEQIGEQSERALEAELEDGVGDGGQVVHIAEHRYREDVAPGQTLQRRDGVARQHGCSIMEAQALAQGDLPGPAAILDDVAGGHLRTRAHGVVHAIQRVVHQVGVVAGDQGRCQVRVEQGDVRLRHEFQQFRVAGGPHGGGSEGSGGRTGQEVTASHRGAPLCDAARLWQR